MPIVKLDATSSTNDFLKELAANQHLANFTAVTAENQTNGRGQMGAKWHSQAGKNLITSILIRDVIFDVDNIYNLNICVALAVFEALRDFEISETTIKWPNDIMSGHKKLGGILIENLIKSNKEIISIVGLGLNVNQRDFESLPNASSLSIVLGKEVDRDELLLMIIDNIKQNVGRLQQNEIDMLWSEYNSVLFKRGIPIAFESSDGKRFMGIIKNVLKNGRLELALEDGTSANFGLKEITMLY